MKYFNEKALKDPIYYGQVEARQMVNVTAATFKKWHDNGKLKAAYEKSTGFRFYSKKQLEEYAKAHRLTIDFNKYKSYSEKKLLMNVRKTIHHNQQLLLKLLKQRLRLWFHMSI